VREKSQRFDIRTATEAEVVGRRCTRVRGDECARPASRAAIRRRIRIGASDPRGEADMHGWGTNGRARWRRPWGFLGQPGGALGRRVEVERCVSPPPRASEAPAHGLSVFLTTGNLEGFFFLPFISVTIISSESDAISATMMAMIIILSSFVVPG
jgi:hypothetical protein